MRARQSSDTDAVTKISKRLPFRVLLFFLLLLIILKLLPPLFHISFSVTRPLSQNHQTH